MLHPLYQRFHPLQVVVGFHVPETFVLVMILQFAFIQLDPSDSIQYPIRIFHQYTLFLGQRYESFPLRHEDQLACQIVLLDDPSSV